MLYLIGLGLGDEKDITIKGLEAIDKCDILYLEHYTSILTVGKEKLEKFYSSQLKKEVQIILADRELIESECDEKIIEKSKKQNVGVLIVGDPFGATTHADIMVRAKQLGIEVGVVHNASIMFEIFCLKQLGMQLELVVYNSTDLDKQFLLYFSQKIGDQIHSTIMSRET
jgi:diphthine methyl ester synthase